MRTPYVVFALLLAPMLALLSTSATTRTADRCEPDRATCAKMVAAGTVDPFVLPPAPASSPLPPPPQAPWKDCAAEGKTCRGEGWGEVRYGATDQWRRITVDGSVMCDNATLGDPALNVVKRCQRRATLAPLMPADLVPLPSNFAVTGLVVPGAHNPVPSSKPDVVGAFRFICTAGQLNYDDPILYPGQPGGSPHLHQWYGNTNADYGSTYSRLRNAGESTCSNKLNRSAYWVPALMTAFGKVIQPDYLSVYYKRHADNDPACLTESNKGCVGLPTGLRVVSGYDMKRMGEKQSENMTFTFRCISPNKPSIHRGLVAEAIADCGGEGQIDAAINFGNCWNGMLDSADHRSHLISGAYIGHSYPECPKSHPYIIPTLTQGVVYTIKPEDGEVWFASDRMNGMKMASGSTFHADYMEGWDPKTRAIWERACVGRLLNCSDGELGDGTMLKRGQLTYHADVRLVEAPRR